MREGVKLAQKNYLPFPRGPVPCVQAVLKSPTLNALTFDLDTLKAKERVFGQSSLW